MWVPWLRIDGEWFKFKPAAEWITALDIACTAARQNGRGVLRGGASEGVPRHRAGTCEMTAADEMKLALLRIAELTRERDEARAEVERLKAACWRRRRWAGGACGEAKGGTTTEKTK